MKIFRILRTLSAIFVLLLAILPGTPTLAATAPLESKELLGLCTVASKPAKVAKRHLALAQRFEAEERWVLALQSYRQAAAALLENGKASRRSQIIDEEVAAAYARIVPLIGEKLQEPRQALQALAQLRQSRYYDWYPVWVTVVDIQPCKFSIIESDEDEIGDYDPLARETEATSIPLAVVKDFRSAEESPFPYLYQIEILEDLADAMPQHATALGETIRGIRFTSVKESFQGLRQKIRGNFQDIRRGRGIEVSSYRSDSASRTIDLLQFTRDHYPEDFQELGLPTLLEEAYYIRAADEQAYPRRELAEKYLERYPTGRFRDEIQQVLAYEDFRTADTISEYRSYLDTYPSGPWGTEVRTKLQKALFEQAEEAASVEAYEEFLREFSSGEYAKQARNNLDTVHFRNAGSQGVRGYQRYLRLYPYGKHAQQARNRIDELDFKSARKTGTVESYQGYLEAHPRGHYRGRAQREIIQLKFDTAVREGTPAALEAFLSENPGSFREDDARGKLEGLRYSEAKRRDTVKAWQEFLTLHPEGKQATRAKRRIRDIRAEEEFQEVFQADSVEAYDRFLQENSTGKFANVAQALRAGLIALKSEGPDDFREFFRLEQKTSARKYTSNRRKVVETRLREVAKSRSSSPLFLILYERENKTTDLEAAARYATDQWEESTAVKLMPEHFFSFHQDQNQPGGFRDDRSRIEAGRGREIYSWQPYIRFLGKSRLRHGTYQIALSLDAEYSYKRTAYGLLAGKVDRSRYGLKSYSMQSDATITLRPDGRRYYIDFNFKRVEGFFSEGNVLWKEETLQPMSIEPTDFKIRSVTLVR